MTSTYKRNILEQDFHQQNQTNKTRNIPSRLSPECVSWWGTPSSSTVEIWSKKGSWHMSSTPLCEVWVCSISICTVGLFCSSLKKNRVVLSILSKILGQWSSLLSNSTFFYVRQMLRITVWSEYTKYLFIVIVTSEYVNCRWIDLCICTTWIGE